MSKSQYNMGRSWLREKLSGFHDDKVTAMAEAHNNRRCNAGIIGGVITVGISKKMFRDGGGQCECMSMPKQAALFKLLSASSDLRSRNRGYPVTDFDRDAPFLVFLAAIEMLICGAACRTGALMFRTRRHCQKHPAEDMAGYSFLRHSITSDFFIGNTSDSSVVATAQ